MADHGRFTPEYHISIVLTTSIYGYRITKHKRIYAAIAQLSERDTLVQMYCAICGAWSKHTKKNHLSYMRVTVSANFLNHFCFVRVGIRYMFVCSFRLSTISIEWPQSHSEFETIMYAIEVVEAVGSVGRQIIRPFDCSTRLFHSRPTHHITSTFLFSTTVRHEWLEIHYVSNECPVCVHICVF